MKKVIGAFARPLKLRDGGGPLTQGPLSPQFWGAMKQGVQDTAAPMVHEVQQFHEDYPVAGQVAQLASQPLNTAVGAYGAAAHLADGDYAGAVQSGLSALPVLGKYAGRAFGAATKRSMNQFQQVRSMGGTPSADMYRQAAGRVLPDAGAAVQAGELGAAAYQTTKTLRGGSR